MCTLSPLLSLTEVTTVKPPPRLEEGDCSCGGRAGQEGRGRPPAQTCFDGSEQTVPCTGALRGSAAGSRAAPPSGAPRGSRVQRSLLLVSHPGDESSPLQTALACVWCPSDLRQHFSVRRGPVKASAEKPPEAGRESWCHPAGDRAESEAVSSAQPGCCSHACLGRGGQKAPRPLHLPANPRKPGAEGQRGTGSPVWHGGHWATGDAGSELFTRAFRHQSCHGLGQT